MNVQEFNYLLEDPASVSWPVKGVALAAVLGFVLFMGYQFFVMDSFDVLEQEQAKEVELKSKFETRVKRSAQLEEYEAQLAEMQRSFGALIQQLPSSTEIPSLILDISEKGISNGLELELFEPMREEKKEFYAEKPIKIIAKGTYRELATFVSDISGLPRIVTIHNISLRPLEDDSKKSDKKRARKAEKRTNYICLEAVIKTYRYLDESEMPKKDKKKKGRRS